MMKKIILLLLIITSSTVFAQKLSKEELAVKMSEKSCECANKEEISKDNFEMTLGLCIIEAINAFEKDVDRHYGKDVINDEKKMEELGYDVGKEMAKTCPTIFKFMFDDDSETQEVAEEAPDEMITGQLTEIKSEQFLTFSVKEDSGKMNHFILLSSFENSFLLTDKVVKVNDAVEIYYYELELYDAKLSKFISYKVVTDIIKK
jgi:outer membrane lipoprotein-sorting protein